MTPGPTHQPRPPALPQPAAPALLWALLRRFSWPALRHHPWRQGAAVLAVTLGVALALAVHLINASALAEFAQGVRSASGQPDLRVQKRQGALGDEWLDPLAALPGVAVASPVLEATVQALRPGGQARAPVVTLRLLGVDALTAPRLAPGLAMVPHGSGGAGPRLDVFAPDALFLNPAAQAALGLSPPATPGQGPDAQGANTQGVALQVGMALVQLRWAGTVSAGGPPLAVMDVAAAQALLGRPGELDRIDLQLAPGATPREALARLTRPADLVAEPPPDPGDRMGRLSRAYRVNLTVLALVALFTGAFLVFSVLSLSVAQRTAQWALLGVLGLTPGQRRALVLAESAVLGVVGSALGVALGAALAAWALWQLGGDLGGGLFSAQSPALQMDGLAATVCAALGVGAAVLGGWWPARAAERLQPAQALKGDGGAHNRPSATAAWTGLALLALGTALAWAPPWNGVPVAAYASVALLLLGGVASLPVAVGLALDRLAPWVQSRALPLLAVERARRRRDTAAVSTSGVVASVALSVALTVMVASFRDSVTRWLDVVLPADLYLRAGTSQTTHFDPALVQALAATPGVAGIDGLRVLPLNLDNNRPPVTLIARDGLPAALPMVDDAAGAARSPGVTLYVSEAVAAVYGVQAGQPWPQALSDALPGGPAVSYRVGGVWRDYARQHGSIAMTLADYRALTGDTRLNDLALRLEPGADAQVVTAALRETLRLQLPAALAETVEIASAQAIRETSLRIFDRSFAVTHWLQAVAVGMGLMGVAASFSAQALARQREFGLLAHLGLTRGQIEQLVAWEGAVWSALGALAGVALGLAVSVVLVKVVNPQSFHWTMELALPWERLLALWSAVVVAGTLTVWLAGRAAASRQAVQSVRQDW